MEHCFLCGITLSAGKGRRYRCPLELRAFVTNKCQPTPMAYAHITEGLVLQHETPICIPCVNWKRRTERRSGKSYLQVDQLIGYILQPGRMQDPDSRCLVRLIEALQDQTSPFARAHVIPLPVLEILSRMEARDLDSIARVWWDLNGRSSFFRHPQTAKIIRAIQTRPSFGQAPDPAHITVGTGGGDIP